MRATLLIGLLAAAMAPAHAERIDLKLIGQQGQGVFFFTIPKSHSANQTYIKHVAESMCAGREFCQAMFWVEGSAAARKLPMNQKALDAQIAQYNSNKHSRLKQMLWSCKHFPQTPKSACF